MFDFSIFSSVRPAHLVFPLESERRWRGGGKEKNAETLERRRRPRSVALRFYRVVFFLFLGWVFFVWFFVLARFDVVVLAPALEAEAPGPNYSLSTYAQCHETATLRNARLQRPSRDASFFCFCFLVFFSGLRRNAARPSREESISTTNEKLRNDAGEAFGCCHWLTKP